ncbi:MAG: TlpA family protein disulfide reductase [Bacteroidia bacterium]|nr:TlpA family protein disulfide reductase [Bacteroidia bacterium]
MKKGIILLLFLFRILLQPHAKPFVLSGSLPLMAKETVRLQFVSTPFQTEINELPFEIDSNGSFKIQVNFYEGQILSFVSGKLMFRFYADPDDSLVVVEKMENGKSKIHFTGKGAEQANFVNQKSVYFSKNIESISYSHDLILEMTNRNAENFKKYCDSVSNVKLKYLKKYKAKLSPGFYQWQQAEDIYEAANIKINYPVWYYSMRGIDNKQLPVDTGYYNFLNLTVVNNDLAVSSSQYRNFLKYYLIHKFIERKQQPEAMLAYRESDTFFTGKVLQTFRLQLWNEIILFGNFSDATAMYSTLKTLYNAEPDYRLLETKYKEKLPFSTEAWAPGFELPDLNGNKISLESLKGKIVYLDFWASWCGPCLGEMPASEKLKEHFAGKDVVFVNVSIDQNEEAWKKSVARNKITGINLIGPNHASDIGKNYKVLSIPSYFLIDRDGKFLSAPAQRPSQKVIYQQIEEALKK